MLVAFWTPGCEPCRELRGQLSGLETEVATILAVNADQEREVVEEHGVDVFPTLAFFKGGQELRFRVHEQALSALAGMRDPPETSKWIEETLRIQAADPFMLHWSNDEWKTPIDTTSQTTALDIDFVDIAIARADRAPILFTFRWLEDGRWKGHDYKVDVRAD